MIHLSINGDLFLITEHQMSGKVEMKISTFLLLYDHYLSNLEIWMFLQEKPCDSIK